MSRENDKGSLTLDKAYAKTVVADHVLFLLIKRIGLDKEVIGELNRIKQVAERLRSRPEFPKVGDRTVSVEHLKEECDSFMDRLAS
ncbi:MAG: hypothetical protein OXI52_12355 [Caldilineaceae bacterium]|nr:hypothetical protein [Caldilineaceae bacterium]